MGERTGGSYTVDPKTGAERRLEGTKIPPVSTVEAVEPVDVWTTADPAVPEPEPAAPQAAAPVAAPAASSRRSGGSAPAAQE